MSHAITHEESLDQFSEQIQFVLNTYTPHNLDLNKYSNILLGGLGGSGIGAKIASDFMQSSLSVPTQLISDYNLPAYVSEKTLIILSSYSGNTEETLSLLAQAIEKHCDIVAITAGGKLLDACKQNGYKTYSIELGFQPRMTLGYSLSTLFLIFGELAGVDFTADLQQVMKDLLDKEALKQKAKTIINAFKGFENDKYVTICDGKTFAAGTRFCQQLQENAKAEGFLSILPENNHNMIESYYGTHKTNFILFNSGTNNRVNKRFGFIKELLVKNNNRVFDLSFNDFSVSEIYKAIYILDWVSVYLTDERGEDNMRIPNIIDLKGFLSN